MMEVKNVWTVVVLLLCCQGRSDSQTETMMTEFEPVSGITTWTEQPTLRTPPPPPPPTLPPPPPSSSVEPPTSTPEPPTTDLPATDLPTTAPSTRTPPPPPPPSSPPPPPSSILPPTTTPTPPPPPRTTTMFITTAAVEPTEPAKPSTEPPEVEPNPVAANLGKIGVILNVALSEFDRQGFKETMAQEVNNYCREYPGQCKAEGKTATYRDVIILTVQAYGGDVVVGSRRRLLQESQIVVEYYVQDPVSSTNVLLTTEQQIAFLANPVVADALTANLGFESVDPAYVPVEEAVLEGWEIALISVGSAAFVALVIGTIVYCMSKNKSKSKELDLELQAKSPVKELTPKQAGIDYQSIPIKVDSNGTSETTKKPLVDEVDVSTQVKYKEILAETGFESATATGAKQAPEVATEAAEAEPKLMGNGGGTSMVVTAEISSSSSSSTSSQQDESELVATSQEQQVVPPDYEDVHQAAITDNEARKAEEEAAEAVGELDNLIADQTKDNVPETPLAYENPAFTSTTEIDEDGVGKTAL